MFTKKIMFKKMPSHPVNFTISLFLIIISITVLNSCKLMNLSKHVEIPKTVIVYPSPPEQTRFQYLTKITTSDDIGKKQSAFSKMLVGAEKKTSMVKPYGIAINSGKIYVCDSYGGGMEIVDLKKKTFDFFHPKGRGQLKNPINCFIDKNGYLFVADAGRYEIVVFDENGNYVRSFGEKEKFKPVDVCTQDDKIFVVNNSDNKIHVYSNDSINKLLYTFPEKTMEEDSAKLLCFPSNIAVFKEKVYVSDFGCSMIRVFSTDGKFIENIGSIGNFPGQFTKIKGIAVDRDSNIFAVDAAFDNVQIFNKEGKLLMAMAGHYDGPGGLNLPAKVIIDYDNLNYFQKYVDPEFDLKYLVIVTSQYGPGLINVYGRVDPKKKPSK